MNGEVSKSPSALSTLRRHLHSAPTCLALICILYTLALPLTNKDILKGYLPWYDYILAHGRFAALADNFAQYTPPYLYLLSIGSLANGLLPSFLIIKLIAIAGTLCLASGFFWLITALDYPGATRLPVLWLMLLPTVLLNGPWWGQTDAFYAGPLLFAIGEVLRRRMLTAVMAVGLAFSFKMQAVFIAPLFLALLLTRRIPWAYLPVPLIVYLGMMVPSWLAGRPLHDLLGIYGGQADAYQQLAKNAPNFWTYLEGLHLVTYSTGVPIGLGLGIGATAWLGYMGWREKKLDPETLLLIAAAGAIILPFVLPKMHNRYFFLGDILSFTRAVIFPSARRTRIAALMQAGSLLSGLAFVIGLPAGAPVGAIFMTWALILTLHELRDHFHPQRAAAMIPATF